MCKVSTIYHHLTHWGRVTHICVDKLTTIGSDNGLSPGRRQAIIWTIAGILLIRPLGTNFSEILIGIQTFSFKKMHLKILSVKWRRSCLGLNVLKVISKEQALSTENQYPPWNGKHYEDKNSTGNDKENIFECLAGYEVVWYSGSRRWWGCKR